MRDGQTFSAPRVIICGDRNWDKPIPIDVVVGGLKSVYGDGVVIIQGGAPGADCMAAGSALRHGLKTVMYEAEWEKHGRAAGPIRNRKMLKEGKADFVIAFHNDLTQSRGTKDMVGQAQGANKPVYLVSKL